MNLNTLYNLSILTMYVFYVLTIIDIAVWIYAIRSFMKSIKNIKKPETMLKNIVTIEKISILIPIRNNEETIARCLQSILDQVCLPHEIIVIDDNSTDKGPEIVKEISFNNPFIRYFRIENEANVCNPKSYALAWGYTHSQGEVVVFLDGDTWFTHRDSLCVLINEVINIQGIASLAPRFYCRTRICKALQVVLTTFSHAFLGFDKVMNPKSKLAWFYGCCWATTRDVYEALGTHRSYINSVVEDKDIAKKAKEKNIPISIIRGFDYVETLWYDSLRETVDTLSRILYSFSLRRMHAIAGFILLFLGFSLPIIALLIGVLLLDYTSLLLGVLLYSILCLAHALGAKLLKYSIVYVLVSPIIGLVLPLSILISSTRKRFIWRGRVIKCTTSD